MSGRGLVMFKNFCIPYEFEIHLNKEFAKKAKKMIAKGDTHDIINQRGHEHLVKLINAFKPSNGNEFNINWRNIYTFHRESILITGVNINENMGIETTRGDIKLLGHRNTRCLIYKAHNLGNYHRAHAAQVLFSYYLEYAHNIICGDGNRDKI